MSNYFLTVHDIFKRKHFQCAQLIAGAEGLSRLIKWIHILEKIEVKNLIKGNELILTTGMSLQNNEPGFHRFIEELATLQVAGLCIEYGTYMQEIPPSIIELANRLELPIIVFTQEVPFVEITQDLHSLLINQQYEMIKQLDAYSQDINKYSLKVNSYEQLLMYLHKYLNMQVVYQMKGQKQFMIPNDQQDLFREMRQQMGNNKTSPHLICSDVHIFDQYYGEVCLFSPQRIISEFDAFILDRTIVSLSQFILRDLYKEEKQGMENKELLEGWINGSESQETIARFIEDFHTKCLTSHWIVMIHSIKQSKKPHDLTYYKLLTRDILEKQGFYSFVLEKNNQLIYLLADLRSNQPYKRRIQFALKEIMDTEKKYQHVDLEVMVAIGKYVKHYIHIKNSYTTANDTLQIRWKIKDASFFYEDLYLHHMLFQIQKNQSIMDMAYDYLFPLYEYDRKHNSKLVETLRVYLQTNGLKKETAQKLYIVRQTLYHRLEKIEQLLGKDFMSPEKRLALELMLLSMQK